ncbi:LysR family transcriptional regulator [Sphingobium sp. AP49]|uniref:LysR family transcriptional regulator n=1 Tax=Sphingobium sp. AP49 TaxID=1144307 RepID=UPI00026EDAC9|nr:LysR family transcriptional regulator [Sphingobium sp. AP49]WHO38872.1 LysR family transcriptional regulator [Sphingobium sp. AP49]
MELKQLRYFARIAQDGSLTKAAGVLGIAQPALSRQMRMLEQELGIALFRRTARGMNLTEAGDRLLASVAGPLYEIDRATRSIGKPDDRIEGEFTIGMPPGIGEVFGRSFVLLVKQIYPQIRLRMVEGNTGSLQDWLLRAVIDFAVLEEPAADLRVSQRCVRDEPLVLITQNSAPDCGPLDLEETSRLPLILPSHHLGIRRTINTAALAAGLALTPAIEVDAPHLAMRLVSDGLGCAILPACFAILAESHGPLALRAFADTKMNYRLFLTVRDQVRFHKGRAETCIADLLGNAIGVHALKAE